MKFNTMSTEGKTTEGCQCAIVIGLFLVFLTSADRVAGDMLMRQQPESLPDFLLEEVILDSLVNSMSPLPEDRIFLPNVLDSVEIPEREIGFFMFNKVNPIDPVKLRIGDVTSLKTSNFSFDKPIKVLIHGWTDTVNSSWMQDFRKNYLKSGDYNVILVDWSVGSLKEYLIATRLTKQVSDYLTQLLQFLIMEGVTTAEDIHILGHSLGAHIAGLVGNSFSGNIARITGMDPARPDFESPFLKDPKDRLDLSDAKFVDIIHTCAGTVGFVRPIGHIDFYPNGGSFRQPGCPVLMTQYCSHGRSHQFMAESIVNPFGFPAVECNGWKEFKSNKCNKNKVVHMGEKVELDARGIYFLETNAEQPFGRGEL